MKRPDLLILIAVWEFLTAAVALAGVVLIALFAVSSVVVEVSGDFVVRGVGATLVSIGALVLLTFCGFGVAAGVGVLMGKEWGRIAAIVHSALSAFWVPVGTVIGVLALVYLTKQEIRDYFQGGGQ